MSSDPNVDPVTQGKPGEPIPTEANDPDTSQREGGAEPSGSSAEDSSDTPRRRILIGSQRDPAAYRPKPKRDWVPEAPREEPSAAVGEPQPVAAQVESPVTGEATAAQPSRSESASGSAAAAASVASCSAIAPPLATVPPTASAPPVVPSDPAPAPVEAPTAPSEPSKSEGRDRRRGRDRREKPPRPRVDPEMVVTKTVDLPNLRAALPRSGAGDAGSAGRHADGGSAGRSRQ